LRRYGGILLNIGGWPKVGDITQKSSKIVTRLQQLSTELEGLFAEKDCNTIKCLTNFGHSPWEAL